VSPAAYDRLVRYDEFKQRVRRHAPLSLLAEIAKRSLVKLDRDSWLMNPRVETPWALAGAARASILYGNDHRSAARPVDVLKICAAFAAVSPTLTGVPDEEFIRTFMLQATYEQFPFQGMGSNDIARSLAMFRDSLRNINADVLTEAAIEDALGGSVRDFIGVVWLMFASANANNGTFLDEWIDQPQFRPVLEGISAPQLRSLIKTAYSADLRRLREIGLERTEIFRDAPDREKFAFNPLASRPLVEMSAGEYVIPSPLLLLRRPTTTGIYYALMEAVQGNIGKDLGNLFEQYVKEQIAQLPGARVISEVTYGKSQKKTIDLFVVVAGILFLVECKAPRLTEAARLGDQTALQNDLKRMISKAYDQISTTAQLLRRPPKELVEAGVPADLPVRGVVVTLEPYYLINGIALAPYIPATEVPTTVTSIHDLEGMIGLGITGPNFAEQMTHVEADPTGLRPLEVVRTRWPDETYDNPILEAAKRDLPWDLDNDNRTP
jgi:hypothetical protein